MPFTTKQLGAKRVNCMPGIPKTCCAPTTFICVSKYNVWSEQGNQEGVSNFLRHREDTSNDNFKASQLQSTASILGGLGRDGKNYILNEKDNNNPINGGILYENYLNDKGSANWDINENRSSNFFQSLSSKVSIEDVRSRGILVKIKKLIIETDDGEDHNDGWGNNNINFPENDNPFCDKCDYKLHIELHRDDNLDSIYKDLTNGVIIGRKGKEKIFYEYIEKKLIENADEDYPRDNNTIRRLDKNYRFKFTIKNIVRGFMGTEFDQDEWKVNDIIMLLKPETVMPLYGLKESEDKPDGEECHEPRDNFDVTHGIKPYNDQKNKYTQGEYFSKVHTPKPLSVTKFNELRVRCQTIDKAYICVDECNTDDNIELEKRIDINLQKGVPTFAYVNRGFSTNIPKTLDGDGNETNPDADVNTGQDLFSIKQDVALDGEGEGGGNEFKPHILTCTDRGELNTRNYSLENFLYTKEKRFKLETQLEANGVTLTINYIDKTYLNILNKLNSGYIKINNEIIYYKGVNKPADVNPDNFTFKLNQLIRGQFNTLPQIHEEESIVRFLDYSYTPQLDQCLDKKFNFTIDNTGQANAPISHEVISKKTSDLKEVVLNLSQTLAIVENELTLHGSKEAITIFFHNLSKEPQYIKINSEIIWFGQFTNGNTIKLSQLKRGQFGTTPSLHQTNSLVYLFNYSNNPALDKCLDKKFNFTVNHKLEDTNLISHEVISTKTSDLKEVVLNLSENLTETILGLKLHGSEEAISKFFHNLTNNTSDKSGYVKINSEIIYFENYNRETLTLLKLSRGQFGTTPSLHLANSLVYLFNYSNNPALDKCLDKKFNFKVNHLLNPINLISQEVISTKTSDLKEVVLNLLEIKTIDENRVLELYGSEEAISKFFHNLTDNNNDKSGYVKINSEIIWFREFTAILSKITLSGLKRGQFGTTISPHQPNSLVYLFNYSNNPAFDKCLDKKFNFESNHLRVPTNKNSHEVISTKITDLKEIVLNLSESVTSTENKIILYGGRDALSNFFYNLTITNSVENTCTDKQCQGYIKINSEIIWFKEYSSFNNTITLSELKRGQFSTNPGFHKKNSLVYLFNYSNNPASDKCLAYEEIKDDGSNEENSFFTKVGGVEKQYPTYEGGVGKLSDLPDIKFNYPEKNRPINLDKDGSVRVVTANDKLVILNYWSEITELVGDPPEGPHGLHEQAVDGSGLARMAYFNKDFQDPEENIVENAEEDCHKLLTDKEFYNNWIPLKLNSDNKIDNLKKKYMKNAHVEFEITNRFKNHFLERNEFANFRELSKNIGFYKKNEGDRFSEKPYQKTMSIDTSNFRYITIYAICNRVFNNSNILVNSKVFIEYSHNNINFYPYDNVDNLLLKNRSSQNGSVTRQYYFLSMTNTSIKNSDNCYRQLDFRFSNSKNTNYSQSVPVTLGPGLPKFIRFKHERDNILDQAAIDDNGDHKNIDKYLFFCQLFN